MSTVKDKVVIVTGGGQGLGAAICRTLAEDGATVIPVDIQKNKLENIVQEIKNNKGQVEGFEMNIADESSVKKVIQQIIDKYQKIDAVINNAGIDYTLSIEEMSYDQFRRVLEVNLCGPFNVSKAVYTHMKQNGNGQIVNIASTAAKRAWPNASAYHASKWGLLGFSHALHTEARPHGVKVTAVIAGGMRTPFLLDRFPDLDPGVLQDPANVAETVCFVLTQPDETVIPEVTVIPMRESSWP